MLCLISLTGRVDHSAFICPDARWDSYNIKDLLSLLPARQSCQHRLNQLSHYHLIKDPNLCFVSVVCKFHVFEDMCKHCGYRVVFLCCHDEDVIHHQSNTVPCRVSHAAQLLWHEASLHLRLRLLLIHQAVLPWRVFSHAGWETSGLRALHHEQLLLLRRQLLPRDLRRLPQRRRLLQLRRILPALLGPLVPAASLWWRVLALISGRMGQRCVRVEVHNDNVHLGLNVVFRWTLRIVNLCFKTSACWERLQRFLTAPACEEKQYDSTLYLFRNIHFK